MHNEETEKLPICPLLAMTREGGCRCWGDLCAWWSGCRCAVQALDDLLVQLDSINASLADSGD